MKPLIALSLSAIVLSGCIGMTPNRDSGSLKVASWNIEHLAERDGEGCSPRTEADYARLRDHVRALDADVIAFQEVQNKAAAERVFDPAIYDVVMSGRPPSTRSSECRGQPGLFIQNQAVGFAIRKGVPWTRHPDLNALALGSPDLRWGVDVTVSRGRPVGIDIDEEETEGVVVGAAYGAEHQMQGGRDQQIEQASSDQEDHAGDDDVDAHRLHRHAHHHRRPGTGEK